MRSTSRTWGVVLLGSLVLVGLPAQADMLDVLQYEGVGQEVYEDPSSPVPLTADAGGGQVRDTSLTSVHVPRFVLTALGGGAAGALLGTAGYLVANRAMCAGTGDSTCALGTLLVGGGLGATFGLVGGTMLVGTLMDGDGAWWGVLGGALVGAGLGITASNFVPNEHMGTVLGATMVGTVLLGALGYELTSHHSARYFREHRYALAPTVLPDSRGTLGAGLAFSGTWP